MQRPADPHMVFGHGEGLVGFADSGVNLPVALAIRQLVAKVDKLLHVFQLPSIDSDWVVR